MTDQELPQPVSVTDFYLKAVHDRLGELLDRIPARPAEPADGTVELTEPQRPAPRARTTAGSGSGKKPAGRRGSSRPASPKPSDE